MRAMNFRLAALSLAVTLAGSSLALAQCPNCGPQHAHFFGHPNYRVGDYSRYGGFDANAYYNRGLCGPPSDAGDCIYRHYPQGDLFRQYYVGSNCGGPGAAMYPAPYTGIPPHVGHVYYTYEPLYPHEYLYPHHRTYHRYYDDGRGLTRTCVNWKVSHVGSALKVIPFALIP